MDVNVSCNGIVNYKEKGNNVLLISFLILSKKYEFILSAEIDELLHSQECLRKILRQFNIGKSYRIMFQGKSDKDMVIFSLNNNKLDILDCTEGEDSMLSSTDFKLIKKLINTVCTYIDSYASVGGIFIDTITNERLIFFVLETTKRDRYNNEYVSYKGSAMMSYNLAIEKFCDWNYKENNLFVSFHPQFPVTFIYQDGVIYYISDVHGYIDIEELNRIKTFFREIEESCTEQY